ncbi:1-(5-phosphoribosyl)-5-[(5-phosphoribosylamino)methylideneamino] imidazole-4-carboxamide isomerase [Anaerovirgula multivorans]|uniref:1-(5-phosphoribosyl)-5-[(5-phosphoribosylamino)methylideneamino] imidazole-4-carboxamide isomerase n=1 Tax=Anaerovirgula multivorans TaxID=312168 RepID=A0A239G3F9_9FIRM|nr:1-(5-phosphoribosyl)-5-[(5-phosphoribosylamino)methylideneamino]imidazole-4-carboxamide isomerase [Anaerovirgula multivorans]SNS63132.1 1-(5-phosphoribosyl)-5-[(5-phosphoribosylamino)methylideneamino] imidazole-4-carboxamide isomerase [Anaerovirgula multivorans]
MIIYPAIDIKDGRCVRLTQGKFDEEKVYFQDPQEVAKLWEQKGAQVLHIVDLDGALEGRSKNLSVIERIVETVDIPLQLGGGIRSLEAIEALISIGVKRVILGTKAVQDKEMLKKAVELYGDRIVVSIDAKAGFVAVDGWTKTSTVKAIDFAKEIELLGVKTIVYTDIARDGMMKGPNFHAIKELKNYVAVDIIASGGVSSLEDLETLSEIGVAGVIVGKALYEGKVDLADVKVG